MRHQADDVARLVAEPGDRRLRSVRIGRVADVAGGVGVAEDDLTVRLEPGDDVRLGEVVALAVRDRNPQHLPAAARHRERRIGLLDADVHVLAAELQRRFRSIAPGSSPASSSTWKPLQMPSTGPPPAAKRSTARMMGEKRAIAPVRR